jgi:hypothetical protein
LDPLVVFRLDTCRFCLGCPWFYSAFLFCASVTQARDSGFSDYLMVVHRAAKKDSGALKRLFYIDAKTSWDAAGGEMQNSVMRQMLLIWGDYDFAEALARQPAEIRKAVSSNFRLQPQDKNFAILFPRTAAIGEEVLPKR